MNGQPVNNGEREDSGTDKTKDVDVMKKVTDPNHGGKAISQTDGDQK
ncbi:hypothetical protein [Pseudalkalibacillus decolorationis]|nr:hypothetical protein [Pseudalkalibacillus decolorationis]